MFFVNLKCKSHVRREAVELLVSSTFAQNENGGKQRKTEKDEINEKQLKKRTEKKRWETVGNEGKQWETGGTVETKNENRTKIGTKMKTKKMTASRTYQHHELCGNLFVKRINKM